MVPVDDSIILGDVLDGRRGYRSTKQFHHDPALWSLSLVIPTPKIIIFQNKRKE